MKDVIAIILAGGKSKRFKSRKSKILHNFLGKPLVQYAIDTLRETGIKDIYLVVGGKSRNEIMKTFNSYVNIVQQKIPLGTGDAVKKAMEILDNDKREDILIVPGDTPFLEKESIQFAIQFHRKNKPACTVLTSRVKDPTGYGRIVRNRKKVLKIVEEIKADKNTKKIKEINTGVYIFKKEHLKASLKKLIPDNEKNEYFLTDCIQILNSAGYNVYSVLLKNPIESIGINTREDFQKALSLMKEKIIKKLFEKGVNIIDPNSLYIESDVKIEEDTSIYPFVCLKGKTVIERECEIGPFVFLEDVYVGKGKKIKGPVYYKSKII